MTENLPDNSQRIQDAARLLITEKGKQDSRSSGGAAVDERRN